MKNLKIKVMTEQESKEAQELFFELGAEWKYRSIGKNFHFNERDGFLYCDGCCISTGDKDKGLKYFNKLKTHMDVTLPQLRDKVVLHRNDVRDATHIRVRDEKIYFKSSEDRIYHMLDCEWVLSTWENSQLEPQLKPIKGEKQMENLISGKEVYQALADGKEVEVFFGTSWCEALGITIHTINTGEYKFRLKPRTIKIGDVEVPVPFEPKIGDEFYFVAAVCVDGYSWKKMYDDTPEHLTELGAWRTESEIKQVVAALRKLMGVAK